MNFLYVIFWASVSMFLLVWVCSKLQDQCPDHPKGKRSWWRFGQNSCDHTIRCVKEWGWGKYEYDSYCEYCHERKNDFAVSRNDMRARGISAKVLDRADSTKRPVWLYTADIHDGHCNTCDRAASVCQCEKGDISG